MRIRRARVLLFLVFPHVATPVAQPVVPIVLMIAAVCTAIGYGMQPMKGAEFWRFFASLTMFGAVSAMVAAGVGITVPRRLLAFARLMCERASPRGRERA